MQYVLTIAQSSRLELKGSPALYTLLVFTAYIMSSFEEIPVLDWSLLSGGSESRAKFISQLRSAMTEVGFMYILNPPIEEVCLIYMRANLRMH